MALSLTGKFFLPLTGYMIAECELLNAPSMENLESGRLCPQCSRILASLMISGMGTSSRISSPTLSLAISALLVAKKAAGRRDCYLTSLRQYLTAFARGRETMAVSALTLADVEDWFASRAEAATTKRSNLGRLSSLFQFCVRRKWRCDNPVDDMEIPMLDKEAPEIFTPFKSARALVWTSNHEPRFLAWLVLSTLIGLRPEAEADKTDWSAIDLNNARIKVAGAGTKVRHHRIIDLRLIPNAVAWLKYAKENGAELPLTKPTRRRFMRRLREALFLQAWPQDILRHTAASHLMAFHNHDAGKVAGILGNSADVVHDDYKALVIREHAEKFFGLQPPNLSATMNPDEARCFQTRLDLPAMPFRRQTIQENSGQFCH